MIEYYYRLQTDAAELCDHILGTNVAHLDYQHYFNFEAAALSREVWQRNPALAQINETFPIQQAGVLRIGPYKGYDWHTDTERRLAINMLLPTVTNGRHPSETLFSPDYGDGVQYNLHRLMYQPGSLYVFNTQIQHTVLNFDEPRYVFSVEFQASAPTTYLNVRDYCMASGL